MHLFEIFLSLSIIYLGIALDMVIIDIFFFELYVGYWDLWVFIARVRFGKVVLH